MVRPKQQFLRNYTQEWLNDIKEVKGLLEAKFIQEFQVLNVVGDSNIGEESQWKLWMCIDLRELNKVSLKYRYPLQRITQIMDATIMHSTLSFFNALNKDDVEDKIYASF